MFKKHVLFVVAFAGLSTVTAFAQDQKFSENDRRIVEKTLLDLLSSPPEAGIKGNPVDIQLIDRTTGSFADQRWNISHELKRRMSREISGDVWQSLEERNQGRSSLDDVLFDSSHVLLAPMGTMQKRPMSLNENTTADNWVQIYLPGYSNDGQTALLRFRYGWGGDRAMGTYFFVHNDRGWNIAWTNFSAGGFKAR